MFDYESQDYSLIAGLKNIIITLAIFFKQIVIRKIPIYYYKNGSDHIFLNEFSYLNKFKFLEIVSNGSIDIFTLQKIHGSDKQVITLKYNYKPFELIINVIKAGRKENRSFHVVCAVLRSSFKYSFIYDKKFASKLQSIIKKYQVAIISDPGNPFTRSLSVLSQIQIKYLCTTTITQNSTEWSDINSDNIYVVGNLSIADDFLNYQGKTINFISSKISTSSSTNYKYRTLFLQQYYHKRAFKNRFLHFIFNCNIAKKRGVLTRLHPNEASLEKIIYQVLSLFRLITLSKDTFDMDCSNCRFAVSFSSSALLEFKIQTGRSAKFITSNHKKWSVR